MIRWGYGGSEYLWLCGGGNPLTYLDPTGLSGYPGSPAIPPVPPDHLTCDMGGLSDCLGDTTIELVPALPACIGGDCEPLVVTGGHARLCFATFCNLEPPGPTPTPGCNK